MSLTPANPQFLQFLTPEIQSSVAERTESLLLKIIRTNINTQYASKAAILANFRDAISTHGSISDNARLIQDFRDRVPFSDYDAYKPFMAAFDKNPCKESEVTNLLAPGLPYFLAPSSATSGKAPKIFPIQRPHFINAASDSNGPAALIMFCGYGQVREVEREPGQIVKRIPVTIGSVGMARAILGCTDFEGDEARMSAIVPGFVAPWAAFVVKHHKSFLTVHALFTLACRDLDHIVTVLSTLFYDFIQNVEERWDLLLSSIENGMVPADLPGVNEVHSHLQAHFHANPVRAAELRGIGSPFSCEGWAARVWPKLTVIKFGCAGSFATVVPKVKLIAGASIAVHSFVYGSSESFIGLPPRPDDLDRFVLMDKDFIEFLDISAEELPENLLQAWELKVGKQYEPVVTTNNGLWRYRMGDIIDVVGFDAVGGLPVFILRGRSLAIRLPGILIPDTSLISAVRAITPDVMQVSEFTAVSDHRHAPLTVGYLVELVGTLGQNAHLARSKLTEGLVAAHPHLRNYLDESRVGFPTVRIVGPGTFAAYRQWRAEKMNVGPGQVKVPVVMLDAASIEWIVERVVDEL